MYLRQNSQIHKRPSGILEYSSGNGAWYHVLISNSPNRMAEMLMMGNPPVGAEELGPPGVPGLEA